MWTPTSENEILRAIDAGNLQESVSLDVKRLVGDSDGERRETAKDLASFAIDGGSLLIGVDEDKKARSFSVHPIDLNGAVERVEQIAANRIDPPLSIRVSEIATADGTHGYLFVEVPPSPHAPHMVGGIYYGRGDRTTRHLTDAEVLRLHSVRGNQDDRATELLSEWVNQDPGPAPLHLRGHLHTIAHPVSAPRGLAKTLVWENRPWLEETKTSVESDLPGDLRNYAPSGSDASQFVRRGHGSAFTSLGKGPRQISAPDDDRFAIDIEFNEDGGVRVFCGRVTDQMEKGEWVIFDGLVIAYAFRTIYYAKSIAEKSGYTGAWLFGLHADNLHGARSWLRGPFMNDRGAYPDSEYETVTSATLREMQEHPEAVAERLAGRLVRALETSPDLGKFLGW